MDPRSPAPVASGAMGWGRVVAGAVVVGALALGGCGSDGEPGVAVTGSIPEATRPSDTSTTASTAAAGPDAGATAAVLAFRPVIEVLPPPVSSGGPGGTPAPAPAFEVPPGGQIVSQLDPTTGEIVADHVLGPEAVGGSVIESAAAEISPYEQWVVSLVLRPGADGIDAFNALAAECFQRTAACPTGQLAIVVDGQVLNAPSIQAEVFERDQIQISASFTEAQARDLADRLS